MRRSLSVAALCLAALACRRSEEGEETEAPSGPKAVRCAPLQTGSVRDVIELRGTIAPPPDRDAQVAPQVAGRILKVEVREGDAVSAGQVVARIDDAPLLDAARKAEAGLARAKADRENAVATLARVQRVWEHGIAPRQELDDAKAKEASAGADEAEAEAAADQARREVERAKLRSPLDGVVLKVLRKEGELVDATPATPVMEIADLSRLELVADVPAQDLVRLTKGEPARITVPALPRSLFSGAVSRVAPAVDRTTGVGTVRVSLELKGARVPAGAFAVAAVETGEPHPALLAPKEAVRRAGEESEVVVCGADGKAHVRKVTTGAAAGAQVEVRGELAAADRVAVEPVIGVGDGEPIEAKP